MTSGETRQLSVGYPAHGGDLRTGYATVQFVEPPSQPQARPSFPYASRSRSRTGPRSLRWLPPSRMPLGKAKGLAAPASAQLPLLLLRQLLPDESFHQAERLVQQSRGQRGVRCLMVRVPRARCFGQGPFGAGSGTLSGSAGRWYLAGDQPLSL